MTTGTRAELIQAVETLVAEVERENTWLAELDADRAATRIRRDRLLGAVESAVQTLSAEDRRRIVLRLGGTRPRGRSVRQRAPRLLAILDLVAAQGNGLVTAGEIRGMLERGGHRVGAAYLSNALGGLVREGVLSRASPGRFTINTDNAALRWRRLQIAREAP